MDGTNINDQGNGTPGGASGLNLGVDTILEFKIFTSSFKAEYGHSDGSVVSAVTRSGTNAFHGTAFEYIRNSALDARNFFDAGSSPPSFRRNQFGGVLGGPVKKDKTFFFGGYEGLRQGLGTTLIADVPTALARQGILPTGKVPINPISTPYVNLWPLPNGRDFSNGTAEFLSAPVVVANEDNFMARVDHQLSSKISLFARYIFDRDSLTAPQSIPTFVQASTSRRHYATLQATSLFGPKALNNSRFAFNRTDTGADARFIPDPGAQGFIPGQQVGGIALGGINGGGTGPLTGLGNDNGAFQWTYNIYEFGDDFSYVTGKHSLKTGVDLQKMEDNTTVGSSIRGVYTFTSFADLLAGNASNFQAGSPLGITPYQGLRQALFAVYGQDDYTVNSRLTLNLGLRWETTTDPISVNDKMAMLPSLSATSTVASDKFFSITKKNFEPRVGLAWRLTDSGKTVVRAAGGIYHNQIFPWAYLFQTKLPPYFGRLSVNNPPFPNGLQTLTGAGGSIQLLVTAPIMKTPVSDQYSLSIQHEIFKNTVVEIAYAGDEASHLEMQREGDTPIPTILANGQEFFPAGAPRRNPTWAGIHYYSMDGKSNYNSLTATLRRQFSSGFQGQIFYTYAKALDNTSSVNSTDSQRSPNAILDAANPSRDWGLSDTDFRQALVYNFSYLLPFRASSKALEAVVSGWTLESIGTFTTGHPFTARLSKNVSQDQNSTLADRPDLVLGASNNPNHAASIGCPGFAVGTPLGNADHWFDPCSFTSPLAGTYGDVGRNTIIGPGLEDVDFGLEKRFTLRNEVNATFKTEVFNIFNHANFGLPTATALVASGAPNPAAGRITYTVTSSRQIQFALRINF